MTKDVPVRDIHRATKEILIVGSSGKSLFQIKQHTGQDRIEHVLINSEEAKILRDLLTEWLDEFPSGPFNVVKLKPLEVYQRMERGTRFRSANNMGYYIKLDQDNLYWVNESDSQHNNIKSVEEFFSSIDQDAVLRIIKEEE